MSDFGKLLKTSRFASLAKPLSKNKGKRTPTHQVIETRSAALARQEWGLKYALPSKIKSRYITFNEVDNLERLVDFEANGGDHWKRLRFQELGVVPQFEQPGTNPLFQKEGNATLRNQQSVQRSFELVFKLDPNSSKKEIKTLVSKLQSLRSEFRAWLLQNQPKLLQDKRASTNESLLKAGVQFLKEYEQKLSFNQVSSLTKGESSYKINGLGGLSYGLKGRITNSPNGYVQEKIVPARYLNEDRSGSRILTAIGGFVGAANSSASNQFSQISIGKVPRETVVPVYVSNATIESDGAVQLDVNAVTISTPSIKARSPNKHRTNSEDVLKFIKDIQA